MSKQDDNSCLESLGYLCILLMEAQTGIEPVSLVLQTSAPTRTLGRLVEALGVEPSSQALQASAKSPD